MGGVEWGGEESSITLKILLFREEGKIEVLTKEEHV